MKRTITLALSVFAVVIVLGLAGCGPSGHKITLDVSEDYFVQDCPKRAEEGETVVVNTCEVCDGDVHVSVDGDADFGAFSRESVYEFTMPDHDVTVRVWITSNGLA